MEDGLLITVEANTWSNGYNQNKIIEGANGDDTITIWGRWSYGNYIISNSTIMGYRGESKRRLW